MSFEEFFDSAAEDTRSAVKHPRVACVEMPPMCHLPAHMRELEGVAHERLCGKGHTARNAKL